MFIRFTTVGAHSHPAVGDGVFGCAYAFRGDPRIGQVDRAEIAELIKWFEKNLSTPDRFNRRTSKGSYRGLDTGISWFRSEASDCVSKMRQLVTILERNDVDVKMFRTDRPGYVIYEDAHQIVAEPFRYKRNERLLKSR
jgi:hypothetical protein